MNHHTTLLATDLRAVNKDLTVVAAEARSTAELPLPAATTDAEMTARPTADSAFTASETSIDLQTLGSRIYSVPVCNGPEERRVSCPVLSRIEPALVCDGPEEEGVSSSVPTTLSAAIDAIDLVTHNTARLSRRTARALRETGATAGESSEAPDSTLVLSD